jgi:lon-related putative ATP-dependent protease
MPFTPGQPLSPEALYRRCDASNFSFTSTDDLARLKGVPGQDRALEAMQFATGVPVDGHNVFVLGSPGSGRHDFALRFLRETAAGRPLPNDWVYVYNFDDPRRPRALSLPPGRSRKLCRAVEQFIADAQSSIPAAFESEDFQAQREAIAEEFKEAQEGALKEVEEDARGHQIGVVQTPSGIAFVPVREGEALSPDEFKKLPQKEQDDYHEEIGRLTRKLQHVMRSIPKKASDMREKIRQLEREVAGLAVTGMLDELMERYADLPGVVSHLERMREDIVENVGLFLPSADGPPGPQQPGADGARTDAMQRYAVNVLVHQEAERGAPVIVEDNPSFPELIGRIEHESEFGSWVTSFNLVRAGALHRANGGYLVMDAARLLAYPQAYDGLKRALRSRELRIRSLADDIGLLSTVSLEPESIPLDVKVVLVGERIWYYLLEQYDPEFAQLFKVAADFEDYIPRNAENIERQSRWLATTIREENLRHVSAEGLARLVEESARHAGDADRLSSDINYMADVVREAHYWADRAGADLIGAKEIDQAIESRIRRGSRVRDRLQEETLRETLRIETSGSQVGQINGLAVMQLGGQAFGRPQRITASVTLGSGEVIDIEREVKLGGPLHSKGVLILSGFLRSHYVNDRPLSLSASLVFEQSYGGVDGDSASTAELCVLVSALAELPLSQSLAITGSVDQHGRVQAIGGVNEKIEGFFDLCNERGLSGEQGVLIPAANVKHLMLRRDVVDAVADKRFAVYPVEHVDQALERLTGLPAGERGADGQFPDGTISRRVCDRLLQFADWRQSFARKEENTGDGD